MKVAFFSSKEYEMGIFQKANESQGHELNFLDVPLNVQTAVLAKNHDAVCIFVNDQADAEVIKTLSSMDVRLIALRCAGFNNVDLVAASQSGIKVVRVPAYSPYAIAEHTLALILTLNRKTHRAYNRVREGNFSLNGLMGFDLNGKTVGLIGLGKIGLITAQILKGFGCRVLGYDIAKPQEADAIGIEFSDLDTLYASSDIISLHCPLNAHTHHLINDASIAKMKRGVMLINTSRGALIDTVAVISALKEEHIKYLGLDVYEEEEHLFFQDLSETVIQDDVFSRLLAFNNVLITGHQAFLTSNAVENIADTSLENITDFEQGDNLINEVL
ncbi:2-hydroxyacid dehydrogenase [Olivibacter sitiensis]|uniref:2-hydroxyacid dehydrogenase n=1 Tax=Olivibacter sitiensis TaxID=376470 RepID=UPI0004864130|nr:2-hydroxyacid dehydrogenase [Olivibacter sitiensis]